MQKRKFTIYYIGVFCLLIIIGVIFEALQHGWWNGAFAGLFILPSVSIISGLIFSLLYKRKGIVEYIGSLLSLNIMHFFSYLIRAHYYDTYYSDWWIDYLILSPIKRYGNDYYVLLGFECLVLIILLAIANGFKKDNQAV